MLFFIITLFAFVFITVVLPVFFTVMLAWGVFNHIVNFKSIVAVNYSDEEVK